MVAVVHSSKSLRNALNYNEAKVKAGVAVCLEAACYPMNAADLSFYQKLRRLELLTALNQRTTVNSVHISLNFHPSEQPPETLIGELAAVFLEKIGFAGQPYLLYQHFDAGHPHIHLVTTNIKADGSAINLHNIGKNRARPACLEMEKEYGLMRTDGKVNKLTERFKPVNVQRAHYGKMETKRAMNGVINSVIGSYNVTSLTQLNAVLGLYNITADTGGEGSRVLQHAGLVFRMLDEAGNKVGVPVKASDFSGKPTLKNLQVRFEQNKILRDKAKIHVKTLVERALLYRELNLDELIKALKSQGIDVVTRRGEGNVLYGLTYVDHIKRAVFNGSELGKSYSAKALLERCQPIGSGAAKRQPNGLVKMAANDQAKGREVRTLTQETGHGRKPSVLPGLAETLLDTGALQESIDGELRRTRKKKKKRIKLST